MIKVALSFVMISLFAATNAFAGKCSSAIDEVKKLETQDLDYVMAVDMAVDQCIVETQDKSMPSVVQQIFNDTDLCTESAKESQLSEVYVAQCHLKAVKLSSWILKHKR